MAGVAATGAGIVGRIYLKDATGTERFVDTTDGTFTITTTGLTPPYLLKATWIASGQPQSAYSFSATGATTNITPLTQIIVLNAAGVDTLDALYANPDATAFAAIATALPAATAQVQALLAPLLAQYGVANVDPIAGPLVANHQGMDALLDHIAVTYANGTVTIADANNGAPLLQAPAHDITHALAAADWTATDAAVANDPSVAVDPNGKAVAVWSELIGGHYAIRVRFLSGAGAAPVTLSPGGDSALPRVAFDGAGNAVAVWAQYAAGRNEIWSSRYAVANGTWATAVRISAVSAVDSAYVPDLAVDLAGNAVVTWHQGDGRVNHFDAWTAHYAAAGAAWSAPQLVSDGVNSAYDVRVAMNAAGSGMIAWEQEQGDGTTISNGPKDIWARTVTSAGVFGVAHQINALPGNVAVIYGQLSAAVDVSGNAAVLWIQAAPPLPFVVHAARYLAAGAWQGDVVITDNVLDNCYGPQVAFDAAGNALAVWQQQTGYSAYVGANRFVVGTGWGTSVGISSGTADTYDPRVAVDAAGNATAIWYEWQVNATLDVRTARYFTGTGWANPSLLATTSTNGSLSYPVPRVAAGGAGNTVAIWGVDGY